MTRTIPIEIVVLDRDGVLNVDAGYTHKLEDCKLAPGVIEGLQLLKSLGFRFAIATGQSGIGKGKYEESHLHAFNEALLTQLTAGGIEIDAIAFCPHDKPKENEERCLCRKPGIGMLDQIEEKLGTIDWANSWGVGDKPADSKMILTKGGRAVLVESGSHNNAAGKTYWSEEPELLAEVESNSRNFKARDLHAAALEIQKQLA